MTIMGYGHYHDAHYHPIDSWLIGSAWNNGKIWRGAKESDEDGDMSFNAFYVVSNGA
jgi:hypothetical protein